MTTTVLVSQVAVFAFTGLPADIYGSCSLQAPAPPSGEETPSPVVGDDIYTPIAPGIVYDDLPTLTVVDDSPDQMVGCIIDTGDNPQGRLSAFFPSAISGDGVIERTTNDIWVYDGALWVNVGPTPGPKPVVVNVIPPWNEILSVTARTRTMITVQSLDYALELLTEIDPLRITLGVTVARVKLLASEVGALVLSGQNAALLRRYRMISSAGSFELTGLSAGSIRDYVIGANAGTFGITGQEARLIYGRLPLVVEAGAFAFDGEDAILQLLKTLPIEAGMFTFEGEAANFIRQLKVEGTSAAFALTGNTAQLQAEDYFSRWATQTYGFESLVYPDWWAE
jgi:hypothetical protein